MRHDAAHRSRIARPGRGAVWGALAVCALLVAAGVAQYRLAANVAVGGTAAAAPGEHAADAKAIVAAYDENLLDPAPAIGAVLDQIAARPGVAEAALVSGEGVELTGGSATPSARLVAETEPPAALGTAVAATLKSGKPSAKKEKPAEAGGHGAAPAEEPPAAAAPAAGH